MLKTTILALVMACSSFLTATAGDQDLEKRLSSQYADKVLYLRHPYSAGSQEYDAEGQPVNPAGQGPWSVYGRMKVTRIAVDKDKMRVEGRRAVFRSDAGSCGTSLVGCIPFVEGERVKITLRLHGPLSSIDDAEVALNRVFANRPEDVLSSVPPYWQRYVATLIAKERKETGQEPGSGDEKVYKLGDGGITPPKPLSAPEPNFSDAARKESFQGTLGLNIVVDKTGRVAQISIAKPLGLGLDEESVKTVSTWRFRPATLNGEPVAVTVYVEVEFHLGDRP